MPSMDFNFPLNLSDSLTLSVSPEQLNNTAATISDKINNVNNTFSDINQKINGMRAYWEGYVSEDKVNSYNKQSDNINNMIKNLKNYVEELKAISSNYEKTESAITSATNELPSNILE